MVAEFCGYGKISHTSTSVHITYVSLMTYIIYKFYFTNMFFSIHTHTHWYSQCNSEQNYYDKVKVGQRHIRERTSAQH